MVHTSQNTHWKRLRGLSKRQKTLDNPTCAPVAISSAASFITPNVWKANTQSSRSQTVGYTKKERKLILFFVLI